MNEPVRYRPPGDVSPRRGRWVVLIAFWLALGLAGGAAVVVVIVERAGTAEPQCPREQQCGVPPPPLPPSELRTWSSSGLEFAFQYPPDLFEVEDETADSVRLRLQGDRPGDVEGEVWITGEQARDASPSELLRRRRGELAASIVGLTEDDDSGTTIPPSTIGQFATIGGSYRGTVDSPQGPTQPAVVLVLAASNGSISVVVSYAVTGTSDANTVRRLRAYLAPMLTSFQWPADDESGHS